MRLIDTDALDIVGAEIDKSTDAASFVKGMKHVIKQIDDAPTVDAVPVVHCTECKLHGSCTFEETFATVGLTESRRYCGAGERKDGNKNV